MKKTYVFVDTETDGPAPGLFSMVCFGAVIFDPKRRKPTETFYAKTAPISDRWYAESLAISGFTREQHSGFPDSRLAMVSFNEWLKEHAGENISFISDCLTRDWDFINYYFHLHLNHNPFGYSGRRLSDIIGGMEWNMKTKWKKLKSQIDIHDPVFDAIENAKIFQNLVDAGLQI